MARPVKQGIDYFPLDVHLNEKFELMEAEFGLQAFALVVKLYQKIYGERGYYCEWNEEAILLFAKKNSMACDAVSKIVNAAIKRGIFDEKLYKKYGILTSKGIQERYISAVSKRKQLEVKKEFWLIPYPQNCVSSENNGVSDVKNPINSVNNTQTKEKEIKENKTKENKIKKAYGEHARVLLTDEEYSSLQKEYSDFDELIAFLDDYIEMKGTYDAQSHYMAIKRWVAQAVSERKQKAVQNPRAPLNNFVQKPPDFATVEAMLWEKQNEGFS